MKIYEVLNSKVKGKVDNMSNERYKSTATIGDRNIVFTANRFDDKKNAWSVCFVEDNEYIHSSTKKTGSGDELKVFAFVKKTFLDFIKERRPDRIQFGSNKADRNRSKLYERMVKKFIPPNYRLEIKSDSGEDFFVLTRED